MSIGLIRNVARYIIEGHTINEAAQNFGISRRSVIKYLKLIRDENSLYYDRLLSEKVNLVLAKNYLEGKKVGGKTGHKKLTITDEEAIILKEKKERENLTYRDLQSITGINYTTIYNAINRIQDEEIGRSK